MEQIDNLKELINQGDVDIAIKQLDQLLQDDSVEKDKDMLYYLRGNAYRKKGDWKQALDNYQYAIDLNPDMVDIYVAVKDLEGSRINERTNLADVQLSGIAMTPMVQMVK